MPHAQRLPRKYLSQLHQAQDDLRLLAKRTRLILEQLERRQCPPDRLQTYLVETESSAYRIALELTELKVTDSCDGCPAAPATTAERIHLKAIAPVRSFQNLNNREITVSRQLPNSQLTRRIALVGHEMIRLGGKWDGAPGHKNQGRHHERCEATGHGSTCMMFTS